MRLCSRKESEMRPISIELGVMLNSQGSCLTKVGNTHVICSATVEQSLPLFLRNKKQGGWVTAEYSMLPGSSSQRVKREGVQGKSGRTQEIQRLISRSMRAAVDLKLLGERQILIDCDVINADGGTRAASITGGYVAMCLAVSKLMQGKNFTEYPILYQVAAISCGISNGKVIVDLDYQEDCCAEVDANFVFRRSGKTVEIVEIQISAERKAFIEEQVIQMLKLARQAINHIFNIQNESLLSLCR
ncbi:ribonuclease PH [Orientia chuto str. Dubai]|uniref:Ribonuclease PH n=1 Tax=Orientia chuto str. Dubai TaxID=1359168 RepID=A0A0F3MMR2_9RICK|nr:ribonuclease PH [Candidatus Orientia mediorientalis]KJV56747.1 ribonuclease PH [Orientia chuto str. Dubai]